LQLLWSVHHGLQEVSKRMLSEVGVPGPQRLVLRIVGREPDISAGRLAEVMRLHPSTLTGVLGRLVRAGLLSRRPDEHDGRRAALRLTTKGRAVNAHRAGTAEAAVGRALARMNPSEVKAARGVLAAIAGELDALAHR
jgi:DNA-binding MarR family transcriptional regulator